MKTYRYSSYQCTASAMEDFRKELILQKRIEFWGEGIIYWDYKRLELSVTRGYSGTNCPVGYRMNSKEVRGVKRNAINRVVRKNDNDFDN